MPITMKEVRARLDADEVDYRGAAALGPEALPHLSELAQGPDTMLASKAAYLASLIPGEPSARILSAAGSRPEPVVRVAAAAGLKNVPEEQAGPLLDRLLGDPDAGVRKTALKSAAGFVSAAMRARVQRVAERDPAPFLREMANRAMRK